MANEAQKWQQLPNQKNFQTTAQAPDLRRMHKTVRWLPLLTNLYTYIYIYMLMCVCLFVCSISIFSATLKRGKGSASQAAQGCAIYAQNAFRCETRDASPSPSQAKAGCEWALIPSTHDAVGKYFAPPTARRIGSNPLSVCQLGLWLRMGSWRRKSGVHGRCLGLVRRGKKSK